MKREKLVFHAACRYQTQSAETGIESLWALYSGGWRSEETVGSYPNRLSYIFFPSQPFITGNKQGAVRGFEIQGKLGERKLQHSRPGQLAVPRGRWLSVFPWNTMACMSPFVPQVVNFSGAPGSWLSLPLAGMGLICSFWNNSFTYALPTRLINYLPYTKLFQLLSPLSLLDPSLLHIHTDVM